MQVDRYEISQYTNSLAIKQKTMKRFYGKNYNSYITQLDKVLAEYFVEAFMYEKATCIG